MYVTVTLNSLYNIDSEEFTNVELLNSYFAYNHTASPISAGGAADIKASANRVSQELVALVRHLKANCQSYYIRINKGTVFYTVTHANWDPVKTAESIARDILK